MMGRDPFRGSRAAAAVPFQAMLDQLPFRVQLHALDAAFTVLYRNRIDDERLGLVYPDQGGLRDPRLWSLARRVATTREPGRVEISLVGRSGDRLEWDWMISPLLDARGEVAGLISVVENITSPVVARGRMQSALSHGTQLLLEIAQLAERHDNVDELLSVIAKRLTHVVGADVVAFYEYHPDHKLLVGRIGPSTGGQGGSSIPRTLPCDPNTLDIPAQVALQGRIYRGIVDFSNVAFWDYADLAGIAPTDGSRVILVPWRAGTERMGIVLAQRGRSHEHPVHSPPFTQEEGVVLMGAGHAVGLVFQRKRAESRLAKRARELESLEHAKSHFLQLASHELRGPVALLNGYVSMLFDGDVPPERRSDVQQILLQAIDRMNLLLGRLTDVTRIQEGRLQLEYGEVDMRALVRCAADRILLLVDGRRRADLTIRLPDASVPVLVDRPRLEMVVQNLLDNAFKYSKPGDPVECDLQLGGGTIRVTVRDVGIGITEDERATLFTRFGRAVNERNSHIGGTGLGLFISKEIARMHGGDVRLCPAEGRGSCFELVLPAAVVAPGR